MNVQPETLLQYADRQVIVNEYDEEEELMRRDGFTFHTIGLSDHEIVFYNKAGCSVWTVPYGSGTQLTRLDVFPRHYAVHLGKSRIELYFP